jgi:hypothetical protein
MLLPCRVMLGNMDLSSHRHTRERLVLRKMHTPGKYVLNIWVYMAMGRPIWDEPESNETNLIGSTF